jgi:hypothetical protein
LYEIRVERKSEQRFGQLAKEQLYQRGQVEYGKLGKIVHAFFYLLFQFFETRRRAIASKDAFNVNKLVYVLDGVF